jgi:hypothetical protein
MKDFLKEDATYVQARVFNGRAPLHMRKFRSALPEKFLLHFLVNYACIFKNELI